jgi:hypothetical protein
VSGRSGRSEFAKERQGAGAGAGAWHLIGHVTRRLLGADLAHIGLVDLMVVTGISGVKDREESHLAWEFGLSGTRWHEISVT